ncbi:MAG: IS66 family transposase [Polyangiaceae bacterium]
MVPPPDDHDCGWKAYAHAQQAQLEELSAKLQTVTEKLAELERRKRGHRSERRKPAKMPPPTPKPSDTARSRGAPIHDAQLESETIPVPVPPQLCRCPECGNDKLRRVGKGKPSTVYEWIPGRFRRRIFQRETLSCRCGFIVTAPAPERVGEKTRYAPSFIAHLIVNKCGDTNPQYRLEKAYKNLGIPISRSTMCSLLHRGAGELRPLYDAMLRHVPEAEDVHADETSARQQGLDKRAYMWTFVTPTFVVYRYATTRSGSVPEAVLGDSQGRLVVDQYTGYNKVTAPGRRLRAGCLAHARRKIFEQSEHPETTEALDLIGEIYKLEASAKAAGILGTPAHLQMRIDKTRPLFAKLLCWGRRHRGGFPPRSGMAKAIRYLLKNFRELGVFLRHPTIPPDNNVAEASLRRIALGRSNYLFYGHEDAGQNFAVLYSLVASCEKHGVNAIDYLADVLIRVQSHPANRIDELLPHKWRPPDSPGA